MDRQSTIGFVLIGLVFMAWLYFTSPTPDQTKKPATKADSTQVAQKTEQQKVATEDQTEQKPQAASGSEQIYSKIPEQIITLETDKVIYEFSNIGGNFQKVYLKNYKNWYDENLPDSASVYQSSVQLLRFSRGSSFQLEFLTGEGKKFITGEVPFTANLEKNYYRISGNDSLKLSYTHRIDSTKSIVLNYTLKGQDYDLDYSFDLHNLNNFISGGNYDLVWTGGIRLVEENSVDEANFSNASVLYGGEQVIVQAKAGSDPVKENFTGKVDWITVRNKYFATIIAPEKPGEIESAFIEGKAAQNPQTQAVTKGYELRLKMPFDNQIHSDKKFLLYVGPVAYDTLKAYNKEFEKIVDFGSFFGLKFVIRPIAEYLFLPIFTFLHYFIPNYGLVIIVFALIIKLLLQPLSGGQLNSMRKMTMLQPKITEIKEKFPDDMQRQQSETMKLYSTYGINPASGCLPMLLQMPIFIAFWGLFQTAIELRHQPFIGYINDLSRPDVLINLPFTIPMFGVHQISGLALLVGVSQFFQSKMTVKDPQQAAMVYMMPAMMTLLFMTFPSGLNLYYFVFNLLSIAQMVYLNKYAKPIELVPIPEKDRKKGFLQSLSEKAQKAAEEQQKAKKRK